MQTVPIVVLAGFETDLAKIQKKKQCFLDNYGVHYLEGDPKGLTIKIDEKYLLERTVDIVRNSKLTNDVFVLGPAWMYQSRINNCTFINHNSTLFSNILTSTSMMKGKPNEGLMGVLTWDLPELTQESFDDYLGKTLDMVLSQNMDLVIQSVDKKKALIGFENEYDKPQFVFKNKEGEKVEYIIGHFYVGRADRVPHSFYEIVDVLYGNRGLSKWDQVKRTYKKLAPVLNKWPLITAIPRIKPYLRGDATADEVFHKIERICIPKKDYRGAGQHYHMETVDTSHFAFDPDTAEEVLKIGAVHTPIEKVLEIPYELILEKSIISNSQLHHPSVHTEEYDFETSRAGAHF
ncbi:hypothetical protein HQ533_03900 [Candidatus Woesearchaeota archaeon]|nr:hypothetical protein [Candidatus Woesearchaeota archaeon]